MMRTRMTAVAAGVVLVAAAAGCGDESAPVSEGSSSLPAATTAPAGTEAPGSTEPDDTGGFGAPVAQEGEFDVMGTAVFAGDLELDDRGCWWLEADFDRGVMVLPPGFDVAASGTAVVTADGEELADGAAVQGTGAQVTFETLPGGPDGRWASYVDFCGGQDPRILVASSLDEAPDLSGLGDEELAAMVANATFDTDWPCGYGFAASTDDQRVGLYISPTGADVPGAGTVTLPDDRFSVRIVVGTNLFVNHCDDVAEWLEPERDVVAEWPVAAGSFVYEPPATEGICTASAPATTTLEGAVIETAVGPIELDAVELENTAFGCFAG